MKDWPDALRRRVRAKLPTREGLANHRLLGPLAHHLAERNLWHANTESVARAAAIGLFWAFAIPVAQILAAAAHCVWWRANIPVAAGLTLITNPFTIAGWLYLAFHVGSLFVAPDAATPLPQGWLGTLRTLGWPTAVGMGLFAVASAAAGYLLVHLASRLWVHWRYVRRIRRRYGTSGQGRKV
jgi:uncharacterized protein (DUF2062 family)